MDDPFSRKEKQLKRIQEAESFTGLLFSGARILIKSGLQHLASTSIPFYSYVDNRRIPFIMSEALLIRESTCIRQNAALTCAAPLNAGGTSFVARDIQIIHGTYPSIALIWTTLPSPASIASWCSGPTPGAFPTPWCEAVEYAHAVGLKLIRAIYGFSGGGSSTPWRNRTRRCTCSGEAQGSEYRPLSPRRRISRLDGRHTGGAPCAGRGRHRHRTRQGNRAQLYLRKLSCPPPPSMGPACDRLSRGTHPRPQAGRRNSPAPEYGAR